MIVMAGGLARRLESLGTTLPKAMLPVGGYPYLAYLVSHYARLGVAEILVAAGFRGDEIVSYFGNDHWMRRRVSVTVAEPLGTGHNLVQAARLVDTELVLVVMGDIVVDVDVGELVRAHLKVHQICTLVVCTRSPQNEGALAIARDGVLLSSAEARDGFAPFPGEVHVRRSSTGVALINRQELIDMPFEAGLSIERDLFPRWISLGQMKAFDIGDAFYWDFGTPERYSFIVERAPLVGRLYGMPGL